MASSRSRLGLLVGAVLIALGAGEVAVRMAVPRRAPREGFPQTIPNPGGNPVFVLRPNSQYEYVWDGDPYGTLPEGARMTVRIDQEGYRAGARSLGEADVVVLGDSFTFGEGVEVGERFSELIVDTATGKPRVVNAAVPGYSILDEAAVLATVLTRHRPRLVLLVLQPNDLASIGEAQRQASGDLLLGGGGESSPLRLLELLRAWRASGETEAWYMSFWTGEESMRWTAARPLLAKMNEQARVRGARLVVAIFPLLHRLGDYPFARAHALIEDACREFGIPVVDLWKETFVHRDESDLWVHPNDHHPNHAAHRYAADVLRPFIAKHL